MTGKPAFRRRYVLRYKSFQEFSTKNLKLQQHHLQGALGRGRLAVIDIISLVRTALCCSAARACSASCNRCRRTGLGGLSLRRGPLVMGVDIRRGPPGAVGFVGANMPRLPDTSAALGPMGLGAAPLLAEEEASEVQLAESERIDGVGCRCLDGGFTPISNGS